MREPKSIGTEKKADRTHAASNSPFLKMNENRDFILIKNEVFFSYSRKRLAVVYGTHISLYISCMSAVKEKGFSSSALHLHSLKNLYSQS